MRLRSAWSSLVSLFLALFALSAQAGETTYKASTPSTKRVKISNVTLEPNPAAAGADAKLVIAFHVLPTFHAYAPSNPSEFAKKLAVELKDDKVAEVTGKLEFPTPKEHLDPVLNEMFHELSGKFDLKLPIRFRAAGEQKLDIFLSGQACDESSCEDFDFDITLTTTVAAAAATPTAEPAAQQGTQEGAGKTASPPAESAKPSTNAGPNTAGTDSLLTDTSGGANEASLGAFLLAAVLAGLASLLMPCVFPMIPITVSVFTKQAEGNRGGAVKLAFIYGASIIVVFTSIGVLCSVMLGATGANELGSNAWVNFVLGLLFVVFALSLLGAFELRLPSFLVNSASDAQNKASGVVQVVLMAVVFTLTSFTCTVPFVGSLLVKAADGDYTWPVLGMLAFSSTFALPFFLLALSPTMLASLPSAGGWMVNAKIVMGFLELAFALKFFSNADLVWNLEILTRPNYLAAWVAIGFVATLYLLGRVKMGYDVSDEPIGPYRAIFAICFGWATLYLASGYLGTRFGDTIEGLLPPSNYGVALTANPGDAGKSSTAHAELDFMDSYGPALERAKRENKALFIDFTGITCVNCRAMEMSVFPRADVRPLLEQFVRVQLYVDKGPEKQFNAALQRDRYQQSAQPFYAIVNPHDESTIATYAGYAQTEQKVQDFIRTLSSAQRSFASK